MPLPNLLIVGAQKSGTTWLHQALRKSPKFATAKKKELNFFNRHGYRINIEKYAAQFPEDGQEFTYESSPSYFCAPEGKKNVAERIAEMLPGAEIIVLFRDPVERYLSAYTHHMMKGQLTKSLEINEMSDDFQMLSYGRYAHILEPWLEHQPKTRCYFYDDLVADRDALHAKITGDLGVTADVSSDDLNFRVNAKNRKARRMDWEGTPVLSSDLRAQLIEYYQDDVAMLQKMTGRDLSGWLQP